MINDITFCYDAAIYFDVCMCVAVCSECRCLTLKRLSIIGLIASVMATLYENHVDPEVGICAISLDIYFVTAQSVSVNTVTIFGKSCFS